jgi:SAM-dependent methyltransferase
LSAAIVDHCSPELVIGIEPSRGFLQAAKVSLAERVVLFQGTGTAIGLSPGSVDAVVSGLALNFIPNPSSALLEMARVSHPGGVIGAYVWDYAGKMEPLRYFWDTAAEVDPSAAGLDEGVRFPICRPEGLRALFVNAELREIAVDAIDLPATFKNFEDYWQPFLGGQGPAPAYVMSLDGDRRARLRNRLLERLPIQADGSIQMIARAWAVQGTLIH